MGHILQVFRYELRRNFRRRTYLFTTFGLPILAFVLYFGWQLIITVQEANAASQPPPAENAETSDDFLQGITKAGYVDLSNELRDPGALGEVLVAYADEEAALAALNAREIDVYYVIAADYLATGDVTLVMPRLNLSQTDSTLLRRALLRNLSSDMDSDLYLRLIDPANFREINLERDATGQTESDFDTDFAVVYIFSLLLLMGVFFTNGYLMQTVIEEKETRLIEILISTMRPTHLLAGKILALGLLGLLQILVWLAAVILFARLAASGAVEALAAFANLSLAPDQIILLLIYFVLGYLFFAAAYGMVGAISTSMQDGPQYAVIFTLPAAIPFYFLALIIRQPNDPLAVALSLFPPSAPLTMAMRLSITQVPAVEIILSIALLVVTVAGMIWLAGRLFRMQNLLAGQAPKLRDLPKLLRG